MLCSVLRTRSYQEILGFLKFVLLKDSEVYESNNENAKKDGCGKRKNRNSSAANEKDQNLQHNNSDWETRNSCKRQVSIYEGIDIAQIEIGEKLGSGGFGTVFAVDYGCRKLALKKLHRINTKAGRESFEAEASIQHLRHPNIVRTLSVFTMDESACILMEFVSKRTLQTVITDVETEQMPEERRLKFSLDIARGLSYAHSRGIAHLDIKPTNILITKDDVCKIGDFGCCQSMKSSGNEIPMSPTKSNLTGTYAYRAPELFRGEYATSQCDIYSLGICLWQMLVREKPYGSKNHHVVIFGVVAYNLRPSVPQDIHCGARYRQLMEQCWHKDPLKRPVAKNLAKALEMTIAINNS